MKNKQPKEQNKIRFKILDVVIILLIVASVVGIYFRYNMMDFFTGDKNLEEYAISFNVKNVRYTTEAYVNIGDIVRFADDGTEIGTIMEATNDSKNALIVIPSVMTYVPENGGQAVEIPYPVNTRIDASGRISCKGSYSAENGFLLNGKKYMASGDKISVRTEQVSLDIEITSITLVEG